MTRLEKILSIGLASFLSSTSIMANATSLVPGDQIADIAVFAPVYLTVGAGSTIGGNLSSGAVTIGASSQIVGNINATAATTIGASTVSSGNITTGDALTAGASTIINGSLQSGDATTIGASSSINGDVGAYGAITLGAGSTVGTETNLSAGSLSHTAYEKQLTDASTSFVKSLTLLKNNLNSLGGSIPIAATLTTDATWQPGVYNTDTLTIAANTNLLLDAQGKSNQLFVFNIGSIFSVGAMSNIKLINAGINDAVYWNVDGYTSIGAFSVITGTILANQYISLGQNSTAITANIGDGGIYSLTSYVSAGAGSYIGRPYTSTGSGSGSVPETATWAMMIGGLGIVGAALRYRSRGFAIAA